MSEINIYPWLINKTSPYNIMLGEPLCNALIKIKNEKYFLSGANDYGYYYLSNGYRFGFSDNKVDEIGIDLLHGKSEVIIKVDDKRYIISDKKIHEVLNILNDLFIKWIPVIVKDSTALVYELVDSNIFLIFDIYEGTLEKIAKSNFVE